MYEKLIKLKGKNVEIYVSSQSQHSLFVESGVVSDIFIGLEGSVVFIELDNGTIINARYIIKMVTK